MARILVGITGGIAAYKACELVRLLVKAGHDVLPLPTRGAERFVRAETFFALARKPVSTDPYPHLARADLLLIAPLTAHTLARLAHGLADDVLTEAALAHRGPILVAPAMNTRMWEHEATQANAATLRARGVELIGPDAGELAEGRDRRRPHGGARGDRPSGRGAARNRRTLCRRTGARERRRDARAARPGSLHRQPLVRTDGRRDRRRGAAPWCPRDAARRESRRSRTRRRRAGGGTDRRRPRARGDRSRSRSGRRGDGRCGR